MKLEDIAAKARLAGVVPGQSVTAVATEWHGADALTLTFRDPNGNVNERILYRDDEESIAQHQEAGRPFDADAQDFRLAAEAQRILLAGSSDPMLAVATSDVQPLPHQIRAVYGELLPRTPLRFLLADDPGAGKTIMAGLYIKELLLREDVKTCLIVAPGGLVDQWQDELHVKFGMDFEILGAGTADLVPGKSIFETKPLLIARMDQLARNEEFLAQLEVSEFDLVVVDEAHRMSAHWFGGELKASKRFELGQLLSDRARHLLLMTATPHNGKEEDFQTFLSLLDRDRFEGPAVQKANSRAADGFMRRMVKEDLLTFEGKPLFPERVAQTVPYRLSAGEQNLYEEVTTYVREGMNRADRLDGKRRNTVGFALTVLQRRLASSPEAIFQSLRRRADRLERSRQDLLAGRVPAEQPFLPVLIASDSDFDPDEYSADEVEGAEEEFVDAATAANTAAELEVEIAELHHLIDIAGRVLSAQEDRKWVELREVLQSQVLDKLDDAPRKLIIFSEHRDTLNYLERRVSALIGRPGAVTSIHGGVPRVQRRKITEEFTNNPDVSVLIATDAAGEGLNLQAAHLMVNYDLPWNPNRIEQRFGRIHRIGQTEVCRLWNLLAEDTREGEVFQRLLDKIEEQRMAYGGKGFDVLGTSMGEMSLTKLLRDAIRYGDQPEVRARMHQVIDEGVSQGLSELMEDALAKDAMPAAELNALKAQMEEAKARRLQPHFIRDAFVAAFGRLGGHIERREGGRFEITHVPVDVREFAAHSPIARKYHRVTFDLQSINLQDGTRAELLAPGHPLHDAVLRRTLQRYGAALESGAVLTSTAVDSPTLLVGVINEIQDAAGESIAKRFGYVMVDEAGHVVDAGPAPYLDMAPASVDSTERARAFPWLSDHEQTATSWIVAELLPVFTKQSISRRTAEFTNLRARVSTRLTHEINRLATESLKADVSAKAGKRVRVSGDSLRRKSVELERRLDVRLERLDRQLRMSALPPRVAAIAVVLPSVADETLDKAPLHAKNTKEVERRGVDAVLAAERTLGRIPVEQPFNNPGYDILSSSTTGEPSIRVEVKARIEGGDTFTITRTEVLTALNTAPHHRLALVRVSPDGAQHDELRYVADAFAGAEPAALTDFGMVALTLSWKQMWEKGHAPF